MKNAIAVPLVEPPGLIQAGMIAYWDSTSGKIECHVKTPGHHPPEAQGDVMLMAGHPYTVRPVEGISFAGPWFVVAVLPKRLLLRPHWGAALEESWSPVPEHINQLPEPIRKYIHDLETNADPAGTVAELTLVKDQNLMLQAEIKRLKGEGGDKSGVVFTCNGCGLRISPMLVRWNMESQSYYHTVDGQDRDGYPVPEICGPVSVWSDDLKG